MKKLNNSRNDFYVTMKIHTYMIAIVLLITIASSLPVGNSMIYGTSDDDDNGDAGNGNENDPCYNAGFETGRSGSFNQTQQNDCGTDSQAYYEGFISGCISSGGGDYFACDAKAR
jgi:hypothetical protein